MFTFYVPAEVLNLTGASVTSNQQLVIILNDQWTNVPMDQWTKGLMDQWTDVPTDRWTNGPIDQRTDGPTDRWTNGLMDRWTNGAMDQRNDGPIDQWTRNSCKKEKHIWTLGLWESGWPSSSSSLILSSLPSSSSPSCHNQTQERRKEQRQQSWSFREATILYLALNSKLRQWGCEGGNVKKFCNLYFRRGSFTINLSEKLGFPHRILR